MSVFPFLFDSELNFEIEEGLHVSAAQIHQEIKPLLTPERIQKIERVVRDRTFSVSLVLENIYDRGNISAVLRSAEAFGLGQVHLIEAEKFKESQRTTAGADKWVEIRRWKNTEDCIQEMKRQGKQIVVTHLGERSKPISQVDFTRRTALVLGNEKDGASKKMIESADHCVILPMVGFVQSYNISVAAALCLYHLYQDRIQRRGYHGDLSENEKKVLESIYICRTQQSSVDVLKEINSRMKNKNS